MALLSLRDDTLQAIFEHQYHLVSNQLRDATAEAYGVMQTKGLFTLVQDFQRRNPLAARRDLLHERVGHLTAMDLTAFLQLLPVSAIPYADYIVLWQYSHLLRLADRRVRDASMYPVATDSLGLHLFATTKELLRWFRNYSLCVKYRLLAMLALTCQSTLRLVRTLVKSSNYTPHVCYPHTPKESFQLYPILKILIHELVTWQSHGPPSWLPSNTTHAQVQSYSDYDMAMYGFNPEATCSWNWNAAHCQQQGVYANELLKTRMRCYELHAGRTVDEYFWARDTWLYPVTPREQGAWRARALYEIACKRTFCFELREVACGRLQRATASPNPKSLTPALALNLCKAELAKGERAASVAAAGFYVANEDVEYGTVPGQIGDIVVITSALSEGHFQQAYHHAYFQQACRLCNRWRIMRCNQGRFTLVRTQVTQPDRIIVRLEDIVNTLPEKIHLYHT